LDVREEIGNPLDFIQNGPFRIIVQESTRIGGCVLAGINVLKGNVRLRRECRPGKSGFPRLPRPENGDDGILRCGRMETLGQDPVDRRAMLHGCGQIVNPEHSTAFSGQTPGMENNV
jgi:hypothetical protein